MKENNKYLLTKQGGEARKSLNIINYYIAMKARGEVLRKSKINVLNFDLKDLMR